MDERKPLINYTKEALSLPINISFLTVSFIILAILLFNNLASGIIGFLPTLEIRQILILPLLLGAIEMFYLAYMPKNKRFVHMVNAKYYGLQAQLQQRVKNIKYLVLLSPSAQEKYSFLLQKKAAITDNLVRTQNDFLLNSNFLSKLEMLEGYYLERLVAIERYEKFAHNSLNNDFYDEIKRIQNLMQNATPKVKAEYQKRIDILQKRIKHSETLQDNYQVAKIQAATLEDTLELILEQSISASNPRYFDQRIDEVLTEAEQQQETIRELEALYEDVSYLATRN
ncbi:MAG: hypothetical protein RML72_01945 [Bacteroidia bacterium]|nr:hypothetical protein [Bacteroidia bacterium]MDW8157623.1 hypothetical protein [Bacteroidia bacterium]